MATNEENSSPRQSLLSEIGNKLRTAREARSESIDLPARTLKLSRPNLLALESGNWDELPDEVYALGFLRQYSNYLQIDISEELELLKDDQYQLTKPLTFPDPAVAPSRSWAWITGGAFILLFVLFNIFNSSDSGNDSEEDSANVANSDFVEPALSKQSEAVKQIPETAQSSSESSPSETEEAITKKADETADLSESPKDEVASKTRKTETPIHTYRFEAVDGDVWIQIYLPDSNGVKREKPHREALLKQGYHANVKTASEFVWITCGNAPGLRIKVDGAIAADTGSLTNGKKILRDHKFTISTE